MNKLLSFIKLDFITIKPYLSIKNILILVLVAFIMIISSETNAVSLTITMIFGTLYISYPFAVGEKNNIDTLYITLSLQRNQVVLGRYFFALFIDIFASIFSIIISSLLLTVMQKEFILKESLIVVILLFVIYTLLQAIQLPIYFKFGYAKAKFAAYLPYVGFPLVLFAFTSMLSGKGMMKSLAFIPLWVGANPT